MERGNQPGTALEELGWNRSLAEAAATDPTLRPGRAIAQAGPQLLIACADGESPAVVPARLRRTAKSAEELPVVGDWVLIDDARPATVRRVLPRRSALRRSAAGMTSTVQLLAANIDTVGIVVAADTLNLRRLERMLVAAWDSGAAPAVILTKTDLVEDAGAPLATAVEHAPAVPVLGVCSPTGDGLEAVRTLLPVGTTAVFLGASGAGKSTLVNALLGEERITTAALRPDGKGRHTTVRRELHRIPRGGLIIDTPGIRELQLWNDGGGGLDQSFTDIEELGRACRFSDCRHDTEPGCAVRAAVSAGALEGERLESHRRLAAELAAMERRVDARKRAEARRAVRTIERDLRRRSRPD